MKPDKSICRGKCDKRIATYSLDMCGVARHKDFAQLIGAPAEIIHIDLEEFRVPEECPYRLEHVMYEQKIL